VVFILSCALRSTAAVPPAFPALVLIKKTLCILPHCHSIAFVTMMNLKTGVFSAFLVAVSLSRSDASGVTSRLQFQVSFLLPLCVWGSKMTHGFPAILRNLVPTPTRRNSTGSQVDLPPIREKKSLACYSKSHRGRMIFAGQIQRGMFYSFLNTIPSMSLTLLFQFFFVS
jgi:hypothetical protein